MIHKASIFEEHTNIYFPSIKQHKGCVWGKVGNFVFSMNIIQI